MLFTALSGGNVLAKKSITLPGLCWSTASSFHPCILRTTPATLSQSKDMSTQSSQSTSEAPTNKPSQAATTSSTAGEQPSPRPSLQQLTPSLYIYRPDTPKKSSPAIEAIRKKQQASSASSSSSRPSAHVTPPRLILVLGWMDAPIRLVEKYVWPYLSLPTENDNGSAGGNDQSSKSSSTSKQSGLDLSQTTFLVQLSNAKMYMQGSQGAWLKDLVRVLKAEVVEKERRKRRLREEMSAVEKRKDKLVLDQDKRDGSSAEDSQGSQEGKSDQDNPTTAEGGGIVIHSFSDGGATNLSYLLGALRNDADLVTTGNEEADSNDDNSADLKLLRPRAVILDSSPSSGSPRSGATAFSLPLTSPRRSWLTRVVFSRLVRYALWLYMTLVIAVKRYIMRRETRHEVMRRRLNDAERWDFSGGVDSGGGPTKSPNGGASAGVTLPPPRLYLYSKADRLIDYRAVERHARDFSKAASSGDSSSDSSLDLVNVESLSSSEKGGEAAAPAAASPPAPSKQLRLRRWETSAHCSMGRTDYDGYWRQVRDFLQVVLQ